MDFENRWADRCFASATKARSSDASDKAIQRRWAWSGMKQYAGTSKANDLADSRNCVSTDMATSADANVGRRWWVHNVRK